MTTAARTTLVLALILTSATAAGAATEAGRILAVKRKVLVMRGEAAREGKPQMPLELKDAVATDKDSRAKLFFSDDSVLNLGELSKVAVEEYLLSPDRTRSRSVYRLLEGSLKVVVGRSDLEIHTPTSVAAARGTKFIVWTEGAGPAVSSCVMVLEGTVATRNREGGIAGEVLVGAGKMNCVGVGKPPVEATPIIPSTLTRFNDDTMVLGTVEKVRPAVRPPTVRAPSGTVSPAPRVPAVKQEPPPALEKPKPPPPPPPPPPKPPRPSPPPEEEQPR
jgi:hypothetical protein